MKTSTLNGSLRVARINAEQHLPALEAAYASLIRQASRDAATALVSSTELATVTAAAGDAPRWQIPPEGILFAIATIADRATRKLGRLHRRIVRDITGPPLARVGIAWDITHPISQRLLDLSAQRTGERLGQTIQPVLREIVTQAYMDGLPVRDAAALIRAKFEEASPAQAAMLARTDLNSLGNGGSVMAATLVGVTYKQWLTAEDDKVRETHAKADGQTVPIDQPFDVGGESLDYPGDPGGSDEEVCNCRCTVIYVDQGEAETASANLDGRVPSLRMAKLCAANGGLIGPIPTPRYGVPLFDRIPARGFAAAAADALPPIAWVSDIAFEGAATGDGRYMLPGSLGWRDAPLTLMAMTQTAEGHDGAFVAGRMDTFQKDTQFDMNGTPLPDGVTAIRSRGVFDIGGDDGANVARLVGDETVRGISVDLAIDEWVFRDPESGDLIQPDEATDAEMERAMFGELEYAVKAGTIMAATVCPTPAFADARIALTASGQRVLRVTGSFQLEADALTASAAGLAPAQPPADWFTTPEAKEPTPLTVTKDGRVFGHMALWESCHTGYPGQCIPPPRSPSGYAYFNLGEVECADGSRVACGAITLEALHANSDRAVSPASVRAHYEHTAVVGAYIRAIDGRHGIWVAGALRASLSEKHARDLMGAKPSGDWRQMRPGGPLEMLGVHAVNEPGFPVPRLVAAAQLPSGMRAELMFAEPEPSGRVPARGFARV